MAKTTVQIQIPADNLSIVETACKTVGMPYSFAGTTLNIEKDAVKELYDELEEIKMAQPSLDIALTMDRVRNYIKPAVSPENNVEYKETEKVGFSGEITTTVSKVKYLKQINYSLTKEQKGIIFKALMFRFDSYAYGNFIGDMDNNVWSLHASITEVIRGGKDEIVFSIPHDAAKCLRAVLEVYLEMIGDSIKNDDEMFNGEFSIEDYIDVNDLLRLIRESVSVELA